MNSKSLCLSLLSFTSVLAVSGSATAAELSLALGQYEPNDGVVSELYKSRGPSMQLRLGLSRADGMAWSNSLFYNDFESRVANLENSIQLYALHTGFRKTFFDGVGDGRLTFKPFFGAGLGIAYMRSKPEDELTDKSYDYESKEAFSSSWEVGVLCGNFGVRNLDLELKITDLRIAQEIFGTINIGGRIVSLGVQYDFAD